jgi:hypothetical protein
LTQPLANTRKTNLLPYVLQFCGLYLLYLVIVIAVTTLLNFEIPSAMGILAFIVALSTTVASFVKQSGRGLMTGEKLRFATGVSSSLLAMNVILVFLQKLMGNGSDVFNALARELASEGISMPVAIAGLAVFTFLLSWIVTYFLSGFMGLYQVKKVE